MLNNLSSNNLLNIDNNYKKAFSIGYNYLISKKFNENDAVMFDIDDTLIDFYENPIEEIVNLLIEVYKLKLKIIIITARSYGNYFNSTFNLLEKYKIPYDLLFFRKNTDDVNTFKHLIKKRLYDENNIVIILSIGDNWIDVEGEYSGAYIKLPNYIDNQLYTSL